MSTMPGNKRERGSITDESINSQSASKRTKDSFPDAGSQNEEATEDFGKFVDSALSPLRDQTSPPASQLEPYDNAKPSLSIGNLAARPSCTTTSTVLADEGTETDLSQDDTILDGASQCESETTAVPVLINDDSDIDNVKIVYGRTDSYPPPHQNADSKNPFNGFFRTTSSDSDTNPGLSNGLNFNLNVNTLNINSGSLNMSQTTGQDMGIGGIDGINNSSSTNNVVISTTDGKSVKNEKDGGEEKYRRRSERRRGPTYQNHNEIYGYGKRNTKNKDFSNSPDSQFHSWGLGGTPGNLGMITCNCKKSKCLKLYCECFHALKFCENCNCMDCENRAGNDLVRDHVIATIKERNPTAFGSKVRPIDAKTRVHVAGCHCKKSQCLKKYCECFTLTVPCTDKCRCMRCQNNASLYNYGASKAETGLTVTATMIMDAASSAIDVVGGDSYFQGFNSAVAGIEQGSNTLLNNGVEMSEPPMRNDANDGNNREGMSPQWGAVSSPLRVTSSPGRSGLIPSSPGANLLELAGACQEQEKKELARDALMALSPQRHPRKGSSQSLTTL